MNDIPYTPPAYDKDAFNCPFCKAFAVQEKMTLLERPASYTGRGEWKTRNDLELFVCGRCKEFSIWKRFETGRLGNLPLGFAFKLIYPDTASAPLPNPDLPEEIKADYMEARSILSRSPRGATALLRLCVEKLCRHLGEKDKLNIAIQNLVKRDLDPRVQKALDSVRVIGNDSVHPGELNLNDDPETASRLFELVNHIANQMISIPKSIEETYSKLPETKRQEIEKRDGRTPSKAPEKG